MEVALCNGSTVCPAKESIQLFCMWADDSLKLFRITVVVINIPGGNWKVLKQCIKEAQVKARTLNTSNITNTDPEIWLVSYTVNNTGHGHFCLFLLVKLYRQPVKLLTRRVLRVSLLEPSMGNDTQIWDGFMWLIWGYGHLDRWAYFYWEQKKSF